MEGTRYNGLLYKALKQCEGSFYKFSWESDNFEYCLGKNNILKREDFKWTLNGEHIPDSTVQRN